MSHSTDDSLKLPNSPTLDDHKMPYVPPEGKPPLPPNFFQDKLYLTRTQVDPPEDTTPLPAPELPSVSPPALDDEIIIPFAQREGGLPGWPDEMPPDSSSSSGSVRGSHTPRGSIQGSLAAPEHDDENEMALVRIFPELPLVESPEEIDFAELSVPLPPLALPEPAIPAGVTKPAIKPAADVTLPQASPNTHEAENMQVIYHPTESQWSKDHHASWQGRMEFDQAQEAQAKLRFLRKALDEQGRDKELKMLPDPDAPEWGHLRVPTKEEEAASKAGNAQPAKKNIDFDKPFSKGIPEGKSPQLLEAKKGDEELVSDFAIKVDEIIVTQGAAALNAAAAPQPAGAVANIDDGGKGVSPKTVAVGAGAAVLATLAGIWLWNKFKPKVEEEKGRKRKRSGKARVRRHEREWEVAS